MFKTSLHGLWFSDEVFEKIRELDLLLFELKKGEVISFGKAHYEKIANIRHELERLLARDMLNLHDVKNFLKAKR